MLIIGLVQLLIHAYLMPLFGVERLLSNNLFTLVVLATVFIAIGGYVINDIKDIKIDSINKPDSVWIPSFMSKEKAIFFYYIFTAIGLLLGFMVSFEMGYYLGILWFVLPVFSLYFYAVKAKKLLFVGNITVSILVAFSLVIIVLFPYNMTVSSLAFFDFNTVIIALVFFAFMTNLLREIIKDAEDVIGDKANGVQSIPIVYGYENTNRIVLVLASLIIGVLLAIAILSFNQQIILSLYLVFGVVMGFILFLAQLVKAKEMKHYTKLSKLLKLIMLIGLLSLFMIV